ncbi:MAG: MFS transporter [Chloroflexota bacterium]
MLNFIQTNYLQKLRLFRREARLYLIVPILIGFTIGGGIYSVLLNLYLLRLGYEPDFVGTVHAISALCFVLFAIPSGSIGTRLGLRKSSIWGLSIAIIGFAGVPMAEFVPMDWRDGWILGITFFGYMGMTLFNVNSMPLMVEISGEEERDHLFSIQAALWPLCGFVGSLLGGFMPVWIASFMNLTTDSPIPYRYPLLFGALALIPAVIALWRIGDITESATQARVANRAANKSTNQSTSHAPNRAFPSFSWRIAAPIGLMLLLPCIGALRVGSEGIMKAFYTVYLDESLMISTGQIGLLMAFAQLMAVPMPLLAPWLSQRFGREPVMFWGTVGMGMGLIPIALIPNFGAASFGLILAIGSTLVSRPVYMVYLQGVVEPEWRPMMSACMSVSYGLSMGLTSFGGGYLFTLVGFRPLFLIGAGLSIAGGALFWAYVMWVRRGVIQTAYSTT